MEATLHTSTESFDSLVLRWLTLEKDCPVDVIVYPPWEPPMIELPYFEDRDITLFDHYVVVQFLQERYPGDLLLPVDPKIRGQIRQVCTLIRETEDDIVGDLNEMLRDSSCIIGDDFTLADVYAGTWLQIRGSEPARMPIRVKQYRERLESRPAFTEARQ